METIELKLLTTIKEAKDSFKDIDKDGIMTIFGLSFSIESLLAENNIFLRSVFIDAISQAIYDEYKKQL